MKMSTSKDKNFLAGCEAGNVKPTHRQYRKWCNKRGLAWTNRPSENLNGESTDGGNKD